MGETAVPIAEEQEVDDDMDLVVQQGGYVLHCAVYIHPSRLRTNILGWTGACSATSLSVCLIHERYLPHVLLPSFPSSIHCALPLVG